MELTFTEKLPLRYQKLERDAYAKIIWGDDPYDVLQWLVGEGMKSALAQDIVGNAIRERREEIRSSGKRHLIAGSGLLLLPLVTSIMFPQRASNDLQILIWTCVVSGGLGLIQMYKGIARMILAKESGAISDLDSDDIF